MQSIVGLYFGLMKGISWTKEFVQAAFSTREPILDFQDSNPAMRVTECSKIFTISHEAYFCSWISFCDLQHFSVSFTGDEAQIGLSFRRVSKHITILQLLTAWRSSQSSSLQLGSRYPNGSKRPVKEGWRGVTISVRRSDQGVLSKSQVWICIGKWGSAKLHTTYTLK